jgi:exodeoxyribonuclease V gamma subunit
MPGLVIHQGNRVEALAESLAKEISAFERDPLTPVTIVVQSRGMERWLCMELARHNGVIANARFPFPNTILSEIFSAVLDDASQSKLFERDSLTFRAMATLPSCLAEKSFAPLLEYVDTGDNDLRRFQLCQKIAAMYDQLATFRPGLIRGWDQGESDSWHGLLWQRMLNDQERSAHRPELFHRCMTRLQEWQGALPGIPQKLYIFGVSTLPRLHLEALAAVSDHIDVQLFLLNPCQEYWHDIASDKTQLKLARKNPPTTGHDALELHFDRGHPLLSAQGTLAQEFLNLLTDYNPDYRDNFQPPGRQTLLSALQSQILELCDPANNERQLLDPADRSIQLHSCHAPIREVEVLRDLLLRRMEEDPTLTPRDILVMAPDIESYAPYIAAVFEGESQEKQKIPFSIADRSLQKESPVAEAFLKLLTLRGGRMTAAQVLELLEEPTVQNRSGLNLDDLDLVRHWIGETRICWGVDGAFKTQFNLPAIGNNSWQAGFDRMFLGFALPAEERALFAGILPYDNIEGGTSQVLGKFHSFCQQLFAATEALEKKRSLSAWGIFLGKLVEEFFSTDNSDEVFSLLRHLQKLADTEKLSGYRDEVDFEVLHCNLKNDLARASNSGFLRGRVTFCSLLPMRSIPFKVIALLGMNDAAFPRKSTVVGFDPMANDPQKGDPSRRQEDRYLFLEAILSARDTLIISYIGQSVRDNSVVPPSVVVSELLDTLQQGFTTGGDDKLREHIVVKHRLQGFNPAYFSAQQQLFSYSRDNYLGAMALATTRHATADTTGVYRFMQADLPPGDDDWQTVTLAQLVNFMQNPAQFFLRNRLGIYLNDKETTLQDQEPFSLDGLTNYQLSQELVNRFLDGEDAAQLFELYAAKSVLPQGSLATPTFEKCTVAARSFAAKVKDFTHDEQPDSIAYDQTFDGIRLVGQLSGLYPDGLLRYRCASIKPKDQLAAWIYHLVYCSLSPVGGSPEPRSHLLGNGNDDQSYAFVAESRELLAGLLQIFRAGLLRPLPFFPKSAFSYAKALAKGEPEQKSLNRARSEWLGSERSAGEGQETDFDFCFGRVNPLDQQFKDLALQIVGPLLNNHRES